MLPEPTSRDKLLVLMVGSLILPCTTPELPNPKVRFADSSTMLESTSSCPPARNTRVVLLKSLSLSEVLTGAMTKLPVWLLRSIVPPPAFSWADVLRVPRLERMMLPEVELMLDIESRRFVPPITPTPLILTSP